MKRTGEQSKSKTLHSNSQLVSTPNSIEGECRSDTSQREINDPKRNLVPGVLTLNECQFDPICFWLCGLTFECMVSAQMVCACTTSDLLNKKVKRSWVSSLATKSETIPVTVPLLAVCKPRLFLINDSMVVWSGCKMLPFFTSINYPCCLRSRQKM